MVFAPAVAANAATSVGGWTALDTITAGATNTINAVKGSGATAMRSAVTVGASAAKVGKHLIKGGGQAALAYAVVELLGEGIDWVLDPANNRVKYNVPPLDSSTLTENQKCLIFAINTYGNDSAFTENVTSSGGVCYARVNGKNMNIGNVPDSSYFDSSPEEKYLPIDTVAAKVIANAEAGHAPSQEAVKATALEGFAAGEYDAALDAAAVPDTSVENPTDPTNPPKDPAAPFDPAGIISAINALKALLAGILASITGLADIFNSDPPPEKTQKETDVPIDDLPPTKGASEFDINYINFGGQCPVLPSFNIGIGGASSALTFDMTPLCDMALKIRPAVIAIAYFIGLGVIASAIRET